MRCELFEQLIPLHVGGDLQPHEADELRQHFKTCPRCHRLNEDFEVNQNWLTGLALPKFDEASFAKMRDSVINQIKQREKRGRWPGWMNRIDSLLPKFSPQLVLASATIALAVVSGLVAMVYRQELAPPKTVGEVIADNGKRRNPTTADGQSGLIGQIADAPKDRAILPTNHRVSAAASKELGYRQTAESSQQLPVEAFGNGGSLNPLEPPIIPDEPAATETASIAPAEAEPKEMMRIELQTADPNIRIIWLTPKESGSPANKPSAQTR